MVMVACSAVALASSWKVFWFSGSVGGWIWIWKLSGHWLVGWMVNWMVLVVVSASVSWVMLAVCSVVVSAVVGGVLVGQAVRWICQFQSVVAAAWGPAVKGMFSVAMVAVKVACSVGGRLNWRVIVAAWRWVPSCMVEAVMGSPAAVVWSWAGLGVVPSWTLAMVRVRTGARSVIWARVIWAPSGRFRVGIGMPYSRSNSPSRMT